MTVPTTPTPASSKARSKCNTTKDKKLEQKLTLDTAANVNPTVSVSVSLTTDNITPPTNCPGPHPHSSQSHNSALVSSLNLHSLLDSPTGLGDACPATISAAAVTAAPSATPATIAATTPETTMDATLIATSVASPDAAPDQTPNILASGPMALSTSTTVTPISTHTTFSAYSTVRRYLVAKNSDTGYITVDKAINMLRNNTNCVWFGNSKFIEEHCKWRMTPMTRSNVLKWKESSPACPNGGDDTVVLGYIGVVTAEGTSVSCDSGWDPAWEERGLPKRKRVVCVTWPNEFTPIPEEFFDTQSLGLDTVVTQVQIITGKKERAELAQYNFFQKASRTIKCRSNLFEPFPEGTIDDGTGLMYDYEMEEDIPREHRYHNWNLGCPKVRLAFDRVIKKGYEPQVMEVYSNGNYRLHPDVVETNLIGSIVLVYYSLDRIHFTGCGRPCNGEVLLSANMIQLQILKKPPPFQEISKKRKLALGMESSNSGAAGSSSPMKRGKMGA